MVELVEFVISRKPKEMSLGKYAEQMGLTDASFHYYRNKQRGKSGMRVDSLQGIADYFKKQGDTEALSILASFALGVEGDFTPS